MSDDSGPPRNPGSGLADTGSRTAVSYLFALFARAGARGAFREPITGIAIFMPLDASLTSFLELVDSPVYVVTVAVDDRRGGCLVGFAGQCSMSPERFVVWLSKENHTYQLACRARCLAVHLLPQRHDLAARFGAECGADTDKFADLAWTAGPDGTPLLTEAAAWFTGRVVERFDAGDHVGFLLAPMAEQTRNDASVEVLRLSQALDIPAGHPVAGA